MKNAVSVMFCGNAEDNEIWVGTLGDDGKLAGFSQFTVEDSEEFHDPMAVYPVILHDAVDDQFTIIGQYQVDFDGVTGTVAEAVRDGVEAVYEILDDIIEEYTAQIKSAN